VNQVHIFLKSSKYTKKKKSPLTISFMYPLLDTQPHSHIVQLCLSYFKKAYMTLRWGLSSMLDRFYHYLPPAHSTVGTALMLSLASTSWNPSWEHFPYASLRLTMYRCSITLTVNLYRGAFTYYLFI
jgi:hypothetical protein